MASVDFRDLMSMAEANRISKQRELERRQAAAAKERKLDPKQVKLKVGVQKFLAKQKEEEMKKKEEALRKKRQLMELRNQDRKANSRVRRMINMTKSANKSVIADAQESLSDACNAQGSEAQPDEDDYGYTSSFANEMYKKMLDKYKLEAKSQKNTSGLDNPRIQSLKPSNNKHSEKEPESNSNQNNNQKSDKKEKEKPKKKPMPPPPAFEDLLRLAEEKSKEPVVFKKTVKEVEKGPEQFEFGRPMTASEKAKYMTEMELKKRALAPRTQRSQHELNESATVKRPNENKPAVKSNGYSSKEQVPMRKGNSEPTGPPKHRHVDEEIRQKPQPKKPSVTYSNRDSSKEPLSIRKGNSEPMGPPKNRHVDEEVRHKPPPPHLKKPSVTVTASNGYSNKEPLSMRKGNSEPSGPQKNRHVVEEIRQKPPPSQLKKPSVSSSLPNRNVEKVYSRSHMDRPEQPSRHIDVPRRNNKPHKGRQVIESDEEYDSEMDDFIDDSDMPPEDISNLIGQMFGYNKRKYANEESEDECMESSVEQQMREEARSLRLGIQEDIEDMRLEEEEKRRKALMAKKKRVK